MWTPCKGCLSLMAGTATHGRAGIDGVMGRTADGGSLFHIDIDYIRNMCGMPETCWRAYVT